jgi:hypothetical protein
MKFKYYAIVSLIFAAALSAGAAQLKSKDLIGAWITDVADDERGHYTFHSNFTYDGSKGDMLFAGRWKLDGAKLELVSYSDFEKKILSNLPVSEHIVIRSFVGHTLSVTWHDGWRKGKSDVWKKMPRWRGSPNY